MSQYISASYNYHVIVVISYYWHLIPSEVSGLVQHLILQPLASQIRYS